MKKPNFAKIGTILIIVALAYVFDSHDHDEAANQYRIVTELRKLNVEYRNSFSVDEKRAISRKALDLIEGNSEIVFPSDLSSFVAVSLTAPIE